MKTKEYTSPYDCIANDHGAVLDILTEDEKDFLRHCLDYESVFLRVHDGVVDAVDKITGEITETNTYLEFVRESVIHVLNYCRT